MKMIILGIAAAACALAQAQTNYVPGVGPVRNPMSSSQQRTEMPSSAMAYTPTEDDAKPYAGEWGPALNKRAYGDKTRFWEKEERCKIAALMGKGGFDMATLDAQGRMENRPQGDYRESLKQPPNVERHYGYTHFPEMTALFNWSYSFGYYEAQSKDEAYEAAKATCMRNFENAVQAYSRGQVLAVKDLQPGYAEEAFRRWHRPETVGRN